MITSGSSASFATSVRTPIFGAAEVVGLMLTISCAMVGSPPMHFEGVEPSARIYVQGIADETYFPVAPLCLNAF